MYFKVCAILAEKCILAKHSPIQYMPFYRAVLFSLSTDDQVSSALPKQAHCIPKPAKWFLLYNLPASV